MPTSFACSLLCALYNDNTRLGAVSLSALDLLLSSESLMRTLEAGVRTTALHGFGPHEINEPKDASLSAPSTALDALIAAVAMRGRRSTDEHIQLQVLNVLRIACLFLHTVPCIDDTDPAYLTDVSTHSSRTDTISSNDITSNHHILRISFEHILSAIHSQSLMLCVRSCYHIYLGCRDQHTHTVAHGTLTEIQDQVFHRMERAAEHCKRRQEVLEGMLNNESSLSSSPREASRVSNVSSHHKIAPNQQGKFGECIICCKAAQHYCLQTRKPVCGVVCKNENLLREIQHMPIESAHARLFNLHRNNTMLQNDAFVLLRSLCKLSMKSIDDEPEDVALRSKALSLELLSRLVEHSGEFFRTSKRFLDAVKTFFVQSLLKNCVSHHAQIFNLSLSIFLSLLRHLKPQLRTEVGVFLDRVILSIAESRNSSTLHKVSVMSVLTQICTDGPALVELFIAYDCNTNELNTFQHMFTVLERCANDKSLPVLLRSRALQCLTQILSSILEFTDDACPEEHKHIQSKIGEEHDNKSEDDEDITHISSAFERRRVVAGEFRAGIVKFNLKPKAGLTYLHEKGILDSTSAEAVAKFLATARGLDKTTIGEYLGGTKTFNKKVLYAYVDGLSLNGMHILDAIRVFLQGFRLPGEAQIIDRMIEKFAERYYTDNPHVFGNADIPYTLAFSVIMLNTDAHSVMLKDKDRMTREQFVKNNSGIYPESELSTKVLEEVYDMVVADEIKMRDDAPIGPSNTTFHEKRDNFNRESARLVQQSRELLTAMQVSGANGLSDESLPHLIVSGDAKSGDWFRVIRSMFSIMWAPTLATCSVFMHDTETSTESVRFCLSAYRCCVRLASLFRLEVERAAFVNSLASHTLLGTSNPMTKTNISAIRVLLDIACTEGNHLKSSWGAVLKCISDLDRLHLIGSGAWSDAQLFDEKPEIDDFDNTVIVSERDSINSANLRLAIESSLIDRVFLHSSSLHADAIVHFVTQLCKVSRHELSQSSSTSSTAAVRIFSLQKIVEITEYNMSRIRIVWSRIWTVLGTHLTIAGQHRNSRIAMYAIDSLRQLAYRFLDKDELSHFSFQVQFLSPFSSIMSESVSRGDIREFILQCVSRLVLARAKNVKSGWKVVLSLFADAAADEDPVLARLSFDLIGSVVSEFIDLLCANDALDELLKCLMAIANNHASSENSLQSIGLLQTASQYIADANIATCSTPGLDSSIISPPASDDSDASVLNASSTSSSLHCTSSTNNTWLTLLTGLASIVADTRLEVRTRALGVLFHVLRSFGATFIEATWRIVFENILAPIFDDVRSYCPSSPSSSSSSSLPPCTPVSLEHSHTHNDELADNQYTEHSKSSSSAILEASSFQASSVLQRTNNENDIIECWLRTTCLQALSTLVELFVHHLDHIAFLLDEMLKLIASCIEDSLKQALSQIGITCLSRFISACGAELNATQWTMVLTNIQSMAIKCPRTTMLAFIDVILELIEQFAETLSVQHCEILVMVLLQMSSRDFEIEAQSQRVLLTFCIKLFHAREDSKKQDYAILSFMDCLQTIFSELVSSVDSNETSDDSHDAAYISCKCEMAVYTLTILKNIPIRILHQTFSGTLRDIVLQMILVRHSSVRIALRALLDYMLDIGVIHISIITQNNALNSVRQTTTRSDVSVS